MKIFTWKNEECIVSFVYLLIKENFVHEIVPLWLKNREKNRNQHLHTGGFMCGRGLYEGGAYTWINTSIKEKGGLICGGSYSRRSTVSKNLSLTYPLHIGTAVEKQCLFLLAKKFLHWLFEWIELLKLCSLSETQLIKNGWKKNLRIRTYLELQGYVK